MTYSVIPTKDLRALCIKRNWFTCGSTAQYEKLFHANTSCCSIEEIATIIWLCSDDEQHCRRDILADLKEARASWIKSPLVEVQAEPAEKNEWIPFWQTKPPTNGWYLTMTVRTNGAYHTTRERFWCNDEWSKFLTDTTERVTHWKHLDFPEVHSEWESVGNYFKCPVCGDISSRDTIHCTTCWAYMDNNP
jgi:hypothetical protein